MKRLSISDLKKPVKRRTRVIELPGGFTAKIQGMLEGERAAFELRNLGPENKRRVNLRGYIVAACWVDDDGNRMMSEEDVLADWWQGQTSTFTEAFSEPCMELCGFDPEENLEAELEVAAGNSSNGQG